MSAAARDEAPGRGARLPRDAARRAVRCWSCGALHLAGPGARICLACRTAPAAWMICTAGAGDV